MFGCKKIIIIISILVLLFLLFFLFAESPVSYDKIESGITYVERNDKIMFEYFLTNKGMYTGSISKPVILDYDNGITYHYHYFTFSAQRWNIWFHPEKCTYPYFVLEKNGREKNNDLPEEKHSKEECLENPGLLLTRYLRVYYLNPDGSLVLVWEHPDMQSVIERTNAEILPPESYIIKR